MGDDDEGWRTLRSVVGPPHAGHRQMSVLLSAEGRQSQSERGGYATARWSPTTPTTTT